MLYFTLPTSDEMSKLIGQNHHQRDTPWWRFAARRSISRQLTRMVPLRTPASAEIAKFKVPFRDSNPPASTFPFPRAGILFFRRSRPRFSSSFRRGGMESTISSCVVSSWLSFIFSCDRAIPRRAIIRPASHPTYPIYSSTPGVLVLYLSA